MFLQSVGAEKSTTILWYFIVIFWLQFQCAILLFNKTLCGFYDYDLFLCKYTYCSQFTVSSYDVAKTCLQLKHINTHTHTNTYIYEIINYYTRMFRSLFLALRPHLSSASSRKSHFLTSATRFYIGFLSFLLRSCSLHKSFPECIDHFFRLYTYHNIK